MKNYKNQYEFELKPIKTDDYNKLSELDAINAKNYV